MAYSRFDVNHVGWTNDRYDFITGWVVSESDGRELCGLWYSNTVAGTRAGAAWGGSLYSSTAQNYITP